jgi:Tol biopolymer transport system component
MSRPILKTVILFTLITLIGACGSAATDVYPTATALPPPPTLAPTPTAPKAIVMPTATLLLLTNTPIPPTETATPTPTEAAKPLPTDTPTPLPPLSGSGGGVIAFTSEIDGDFEICVMNADGSAQRRLTNHPGEDYWPTWSPDGTHIAFASEHDGNFEIYVMDADGGDQRRLTNNSADDLEPAWSPDGAQIALMVYSAGKSSIYAIDADGSNRRRLVGSSGNDSLPAWSPDGTQIVFVSDRDGNPEIYVMDADGSDQRRLTNNVGDDSYPAWSPAGAPGGEQISFFSVRDGRRELYLMDADGSNVRQLTHDDASAWVSAWSPSGTQIAFESERDGTREIYVMAVAEGTDASGTEQGSHLRRLTNNHLLDGTPAWRPSTTRFAAAVPPTDASLGDTWARPADGMTMVYVPGGEFQMGSDDDELDAALEMCQAYYTTPCQRAWFEVEQPVHPVVLYGFWLDPTEVTNAQYRRCVEAGACTPPQRSDSDTRQAYYGDSAYDDYPVVHVTWGQAGAYCRWAGGRLPTETEWEYSARGPENRRYPWGEEYDGTRLNSCDVNCGYEWAEDAFDDGYGDTAPVGSYPNGASWCGALDLSGNVWEWTADWFGEYPTERQSNPAGPSSGTGRALRGDAADGTRAVSRAAARHGMEPGRAYEYTGFRCVVSVQGPE